MSYAPCGVCGHTLEAGEGSKCSNPDCYSNPGGHYKVHPNDLEAKIRAEKTAEVMRSMTGPAVKAAEKAARRRKTRTKRSRAFKGIVGS